MRKLSIRKELDGKRPAEWTQETGPRSRLQKAMAMRRTLRSDDNCVPFVANVCRCHKAKEVWQSEGPRISAARRQQLLQQHRGNFLSHVTSLQGWHRTKGPKDDGTKGRRDVAKNANQADTALRFANF
ncbi:GM15135 [Drosophila sechellia]|uniref:GM15135 n=1 Tax=Drosophila sechellia TaxID=7238 RepID=B4HX85_DROSE|nr:GM15135 [Drosophila sechellia]